MNEYVWLSFQTLFWFWKRMNGQCICIKKLTSLWPSNSNWGRSFNNSIVSKRIIGNQNLGWWEMSHSCLIIIIIIWLSLGRCSLVQKKKKKTFAIWKTFPHVVHVQTMYYHRVQCKQIPSLHRKYKAFSYTCRGLFSSTVSLFSPLSFKFLSSILIRRCLQPEQLEWWGNVVDLICAFSATRHLMTRQPSMYKKETPLYCMSSCDAPTVYHQKGIREIM